MTKPYFFAGLLFFVLFISACHSQAPQKNKNLQTKVRAHEDSPISDYTAQDKVTCALVDQEGNIWFATNHEGVYQYTTIDSQFTHFSTEDGLSHNLVNTIVEDAEGNIWFGTGNGISRYDGTNFSHLPLAWNNKTNIWNQMCDDHQVISMLQTKNKDFWLSTCGGGLYRYKSSATNLESNQALINYTLENDALQSDSLHHNFIKSMIQDKDGNIWFTSLTHGGVSRYDGQEFTHFSSKDGLLDDMVYSSFEDQAGRLWFGSIQTKHKGLYRFDGNAFIGYSKDDGLCDNFVTGFYEDSMGNLWICTGSMLCVFDGKTFSPFSTPDGRHLENINFVIQDNSGDFWFGGNYGRLLRFDGHTITDFTNKILR